MLTIQTYNISFSNVNTFTNLDFDKVLLNKDNAQQHTAGTIYLYHIDSTSKFF